MHENGANSNKLKWVMGLPSSFFNQPISKIKLNNQISILDNTAPCSAYRFMPTLTFKIFPLFIQRADDMIEKWPLALADSVDKPETRKTWPKHVPLTRWPRDRCRHLLINADRKIGNRKRSRINDFSKWENKWEILTIISDEKTYGESIWCAPSYYSSKHPPPPTRGVGVCLSGKAIFLWRGGDWLSNWTRDSKNWGRSNVKGAMPLAEQFMKSANRDR